MSTPLYRKKRIDQIDTANLHAPLLLPDEDKLFQDGIALFNRGEFWAAHESWEAVWRKRGEESRIFFQGIIQASAGFHLIVERPRIRGAERNILKALRILEIFPDRFLGIDVKGLREGLSAARTYIAGMEESEERFPERLIPTVKWEAENQ